ncbi:uncharacterized protein H6S33_003265 [Morchella sextelata]|uniref:uncharacterized protein n=1 Tax=Morchella sextelata TaxID=1174677 RepID=UPI001D04F9FF|nr:uncharacterized protein H6S33_003265 [Morchella sextelata]KAH0607277.1 hypothetical protein H6S33_003265 [Morchella sextelata]
MKTTITLPTGLPPLKRSAITIGLELEFLITHLPHPIETHNELCNVPSTFILISAALLPLCTALRIPPPSHGHTLLTTHSTFAVKRDASLYTSSGRPSPPRGGSRLATGGGVEVATPILSYGTYARVVHIMCAAITGAVAAAVGARVECNRTTGLHVHIGLGRQYTLDELKRLAKAVLIFEARMDTHHPPHRDGSVPSADGLNYIQSCNGNEALRSLDMGGRVAMVDGARSYLALCAIMNTGRFVGARRVEEMSCRFYKYNFEAVGQYGTVEFRQAAGTVDAVWIEDWVERVLRFVTAAIRTEDDVFREWALVEGGPDDPAVLERFGIGEVSESMARRRRRRRRRAESAIGDSRPGNKRSRLSTVTNHEFPNLGPLTLDPKLKTTIPQSSTPKLPDPSASTIPPKPKITAQKPVKTDITYPELPALNPKITAHLQETQKTDITHPNLPAQQPPSTTPDTPKTDPNNPRRTLSRDESTSCRPKVPIPKFKRRHIPTVSHKPVIPKPKPAARAPLFIPPTLPDPNRKIPTMIKPDPASGIPVIVLADPDETPITAYVRADSDVESLPSVISDGAPTSEGSETGYESPVYYGETGGLAVQSAPVFSIVAVLTLPLAVAILWLRAQ